MQDLHSPVAGLDCVYHEQRFRLLPSLRVGQGKPPAHADCRGSPRACPGHTAPRFMTVISVRHRHDQLHVMLYEDDREFGRAQGLDMSLELVSLTVVETRGGLVKQQRAGAANDRAGEFHEFLLAVGEAARLPVRKMRDSEAREHGAARLSRPCRAAWREPERLDDQEGSDRGTSATSRFCSTVSPSNRRMFCKCGPARRERSCISGGSAVRRRREGCARSWRGTSRPPY